MAYFIYVTNGLTKSYMAMKLFYVFFFVVLITTLPFSSVSAKTISVEPKGAYADIDVKETNKLIDTLLKGNDQEQLEAMDVVLSAPDKHNPVALYALSKVLFEQGKKEEAAEWFYKGQLRARYDANRCADKTARGAVSILNMQFGGPINQYAIKDLDKLEQTVLKTVEWNKDTPFNYDHRWINLHGMGAFKGAESEAVLSKPESEWPSILDKTISDYLDGFYKMSGKTKPAE